jgi:putative ABC transport system ATP-binding protein
VSGLALRCEGLSHTYSVDGNDVVALDHVSLEVAAGETLALLGPSGSGKSTLLTLLAGLLKPTKGRLLVGPHDVHGMTERQLLGMRAGDIGVILQNPGRNLLPYATTEANVRFTQLAVRRVAATRRPRALLERLELGHVARQPAGTLSGGEQQRLAVAVSLANGPGLLLADEPTSQLDAANRDHVLNLLRAANRDFGTTLVVVTHDPQVAAALDRTVRLRDGMIRSDQHTRSDVLVVGDDGTIRLPPVALGVLPPGTEIQALPRAGGVDLRPVGELPSSSPGATSVR